MANNLRVFDLINDYNNADLVKPSVSYVVENDKVYYDDNPIPPTPTFDGKWKATYSDTHTESAECGSSSAINSGEINGTNLVSVEIGDCVTSIGRYAFNDCRSLTSCTIGSGVTSIGDRAFYACVSLTSIDIPSGVTSIGTSAFYNCVKLTSIVCNAIVPPTYGIQAFGHTGSCPIYVPSQSVNAYKTASGWSALASRIQPIPTE